LEWKDIAYITELVIPVCFSGRAHGNDEQMGGIQMKQSSRGITNANREKVKIQQNKAKMQKLRVMKRIERQKKRHQMLLNSRR